MTDTQQQTLPNGADGAQNGTPRSAATSGRSGNGASRPAAKRGSLSAMLLPELQQLAKGLGINTTKKKKSDLVAAIQSARAANGAAADAAPKAAGTAARKTGRRDDSPRDDSTATDSPRVDSTATDSPRVDSTATDAPAGADGGAPAARPERSGDRAANQNGGGRNAGAQDDQRPERRPNERARNNQNNQGGQQQGGQQQGGQQQGGQQQGGQQQGGQQQGNRNEGQGAQGNRTDDDEFDGNGRRRGRRYRDRRGRNRERPTGGQGGTDNEPMVTDDDVLLPVAGVVDCIEDKNTWFVRVEGFFASSDDVYVANSFVRRFNLRRGDAVTGAVRQPREGERREKYNPLVRLDSINGQAPEESKQRVEFTKLTPLYPQERLRLETEPHIFTTRVIDLVMPIGKGQRALIASPPKAGKTMVLQSIANAIATNNPEVHLMVVLVDERPEEVTDMQRSVKGEVIASTFDRRPQDHTMVAELSIERAKRLVEMGHDVVVLLDSITRLGRAYNLAAPASGRILSGGVDSTALYPPKRFLGAARNIENGGSLTILATALVETGSAGDSVIFEEFKGTGNAELKLDRKIADKRIFPAIDVDQSSTRKEELLLSPDEMAVTVKLRRVLHALEPQQAIELLLDRLRKTRTNYEFLSNIAKTTPGQD